MNKTTETSFCSCPAALFCLRQAGGIRLPVPVYIRSSASVVGSRESRGPLGELFDFAGEDDLFGCDTWEDVESSLQRDALHLALQKAGLHSTDIRYSFAGDLLGQKVSPQSFGLMQYERPLFRALRRLLPPAGCRSHSRASPFPAALRILPPASQAAISPAQKRNSVFRSATAISGRFPPPGL